MIEHPDKGKLVYLDVMLQFKEPELFICKFVSSEDKYIGKFVEEYMHPTKVGVWVKNYYFVGANESEIKAAKKDFSFMRQLFSTRPVMFLNISDTTNVPVLRWENEAYMNPMYNNPEDETHDS